MRLKLFFNASKSVASRLTETFDFVWPTAAAIWNLRWQVNGLVTALPDIGEIELLGRFVEGSGIKGANLRKACISNSWEDQQQQFARFLLFEFCALYESWCELTISNLGLVEEHKKYLQFPTSIDMNGDPKKGVGMVLKAVNAAKSPKMEAAFYKFLTTNKKFSLDKIEQLLICYRYFKELRNSLIHGSGVQSAPFLTAEAAYAGLTKESLGVSELPVFYSSVAGIAPKISLRGVVGFGEIVLRMVCTLDAELSRSKFAEKDFLKRWEARHGEAPIFVAAIDINRRQGRIKKLVSALDLPKPVVDSALEEWLKARHLIFF